MSRPKGSSRFCTRAQSRERLIDARQFLEAAEILDAPDVVATNAIHAAIAAADVVTCLALGQRSSDGNHGAAVHLLRKVDSGLAASLKRALDLKTQAAYESTDVSAQHAKSAVRWAKELVAAAERRFEA